MRSKDSTDTAPAWLVDLVARHQRRFVRFGLVGLSGVLVNFAVLVTAVEMLGVHYLVAGILATEAAICSNFLFNDRWTFRDVHRSHTWRARFIRFHSVAFGGLIISVSLLAVLVDGVGLPYFIANGGGIVAAVIWNYSGNSVVTWASPGDTSLGQRITLGWHRLIRRVAAQISKVLG